MQLEQVACVLSDLAIGAEAIRFAALTAKSPAGPGLTHGLAHGATTLPLARLATLLGWQAPAKTTVKQPRRRVPAVKRLETNERSSQALAAFADKESHWDPDTEPQQYYDQAAEVGGCRALLLEVIRRASFDWVLYRNSSKLAMRALAEDAYHWLFVEDAESAAWRFRARTNKGLMAFLTICEVMDVEPAVVRARVRHLTEKDIMGAGRPAERRKARPNEEAMSTDEYSVFDVDVDNIPSHDPMFASQESGRGEAW